MAFSIQNIIIGLLGRSVPIHSFTHKLPGACSVAGIVLGDEHATELISAENASALVRPGALTYHVSR